MFSGIMPLASMLLAVVPSPGALLAIAIMALQDSMGLPSADPTNIVGAQGELSETCALT